MRPALAKLCIALMLCVRPSSANEVHSHPPPDKLGTVSFPTSCAPRVTAQFEHAVALLHSFAYDAARQAFVKIAAADPHCAMAYWGQALSHYHQLWTPPGTAELTQGRAEITEAARLHAASAREHQLIAAAQAYYQDFETQPHAVRARAYEAAMQAAARDNPKDTEVQVFYALSLIATATPDDRSHAQQKQAAAILEPIYRAHPDHPGVAHYLIHAYDSTELAPRGLAAARAYAQIAPSAPHALHMPSHIFTRLGLWDDSIASNLAARAAARAQGDPGEEFHAMDYLVYAYLQRGLVAEAEAVTESIGSVPMPRDPDFKVSYAVTAMPVRLDMEGHHWESAITRQSAPDAAPEIAAIVYWARAVGRARSGDPQAATEDIKRLEDCQRQLRLVGNLYWATQGEVLDREADAWRLVALGQGDTAVRQLEQAADEEDGLEKLPSTPGPIVPAREQLGDLLLGLNRPAPALAAYQAALAAAPGRRGALEGAARARQSLEAAR